MGFVAWLDTDVPAAGGEHVASSWLDAAELERHVGIVRSLRETALTPGGVREPDDEPEHPLAA
jgi:hypothetical protein